MPQIILLLGLLIGFGHKSDNNLKQQLDQMLTNWHHAAAVADAETYFGYLAEGAVYMGTDATEYWTKSEFQQWAAPWFKKKSAWTIYATKRNIFISQDKTYAWFDEVLVAGFGPARGSGILIKTNEGWKIKHYNLSMTIPNEVSKKVKDLVERELNNK